MWKREEKGQSVDEEDKGEGETGRMKKMRPGEKDENGKRKGKAARRGQEEKEEERIENKERERK